MIEHRGAEAVPALEVAKLELVHARVSPKTVWSFLRLSAADGSRGIGEASLPRDPFALDAALAVARAAIEGRPLSAALAFVGNASRESLARAAVASALEQAVFDLRGRIAGMPVWALAGGERAARIPLYANINRRTLDRSPSGFAASARDSVAAGYRQFKIAPFDDLTPSIAENADGRAMIDAGIERIAAVREAIGADRELFVDCHWRFTPATAKGVMDALAALRVTWFECPIPERADTIDDVAGLRAHANARGMRLAGLEELTSPAAFAPWLAAGAYDVVMPDVKYCGGVADLVAIGAAATRHGAVCAPHNPTGPVCHAASLAACAVLSSPRLLEMQWDETPWFREIAPGLPQPAEGVSALPDAPGLGVELDLARVPIVASPPARL